MSSPWKFIFFYISMCCAYMKNVQSFQIVAPEVYAINTNFIFPITNYYYRNNTGLVEKVYCPSGYLFHYQKKLCLKVDSNPVRPKPLEYCSPDGIFANPDDCFSFLSCGGGVLSVMQCQKDLTFNKQLGECDYPLNSGCCECFEEDRNQIVKFS